jgi:DNA replication protein DnaC
MQRSANREKDRLQRERQESEDKLKTQQDHPETIMEYWDVPKKHINSAFSSYDGGNTLIKLCADAVENKHDVLLCGKTGCGKTHLAVAMMRESIQSDKQVISVYPWDNRGGKRGRFVTVPELLLEIRQSYNQGDNETDTESGIIDKYSKCELLILDDLGAEKTTEWTESTLYLIIDRRNRDRKWTIVTSNLSLPEIEQHLGARIASRLSDMKVVNIKLPDYRKKRNV